MNISQFERSETLLGPDSTEILKNSSVAVFGLGGVGGSLAEALARAGVGRFLLVDFDKVALSNINRQVVATYNSLGRLKADVMRERILDINPGASVTIVTTRVNAENITQIDFAPYIYIADAVDDVAAKIEIIKKAKIENKKIISCMGAGNRIRADFLVADISLTYGCPLAKKVRGELKKLGIEAVKAVFCPDPPLKHFGLSSKHNGLSFEHTDIFPEHLNSTSKNQDLSEPAEILKTNNNARVVGSVPFIPPVAGLVMAGEIILDLIENNNIRP